MKLFTVIDLHSDEDGILAKNGFSSLAIHSISKPTRIHYHRCCEFELLLCGRVELRINDIASMFEAGAFWLSLPNDLHILTPLSENVRVASIKFTEKAVPEWFYSQLCTKKNRPVGSFPDKVGEMFFSEERILEFCTAVNSMKSAVASNAFAEGVLLSTLGKAVEHSDNAITGDGKVGDAYTHRSGRIYAAVSYVKSHFREKLCVSDVASHFGYAPNYFSTLFKEEAGRSFSDFVLAERLRFAYYLLSTSEHMTVSEVSESSGFASAAYFSRKFKECYGKSPISFAKP